MDLVVPYNNKSALSAEEELQFLNKRMNKVNVGRLAKTYEESWWNGKGNRDPSKLDHMFADQSLNFKSFSGPFINVVGWPQEPNKQKKKSWIKNYSDHALIYVDIV